MIYLLRSWPKVPSDALYATGPSSIVLALEKELLPATIVYAAEGCAYTMGQKLSYGELLNVLLGDKHIIAL